MRFLETQNDTRSERTFTVVFFFIFRAFMALILAKRNLELGQNHQNSSNLTSTDDSL